jgi:ribosomal-protein-alanine N-acetyltransferase
VGALVALRAFLVLSALGVRRMAPGDAYVEELAVAARARRRGVGLRLLERCEHDARRAGCRRLCLNVTSDNAPARALYEQFGMSVTGSESWYLRRMLFGAPASLVMGKRLA